MTTLREAAQQALEACEQRLPLKGQAAIIDELNNLRAALAQQAEPLNLTDPAVQKRLATQWGYVPAAQAEPVEPVAWMVTYYGVITEKFQDKEEAENFYRAMQANYPQDAAHRKLIPLYTAPPQRKPLTKEEIMRAFYAAEKTTMSIRHGLSVVESARIVERAHGIGEQS